jgi:L-rhamnose isomerase/sugar isomerase
MASAKEVKEVLKRFYIETPSWAYGNSGTRFKVFAQPGVCLLYTSDAADDIL